MVRKTLLLITVLFAAPTQATTPVTIYVDDAYYPFSYKDAGEVKGLYNDILRSAFSRMKDFDVKLEALPWNRGKTLMKLGKGFALSPPYFHGHDWSYLYPYSLPYYTERVVAICLDKVLETPRPNWPKDYVGLKISNIAGFDGWGGDEFYKLVDEGKIEYSAQQSTTKNILKLATRQVHCIMAEELSYDVELKHLKEKGTYREGKPHATLVKGATVGEDLVFVGYSNVNVEQYPWREQFRKELDIQIFKMIKSGEVKNIVKNYKK